MNRRHPIRILTFALTLLVPTAALSAAPTQVDPALKAREDRVNLLRDEIKTLDQRIESRVDVLVDALRSVGDSKDSRTKVARMKEDTIAALKRNIDYIQRKRAALLEELRRPTMRLTEEQKKRGVAFFTERMEKRVAQILQVQKSLPTHKDYERYTANAGGWSGTTYTQNEDFRQNQRVTTHTNTQRKEIESGLRASIDRLDRQKRTLNAELAGANATRAATLREEIAKTDALIAERRKQLATALAPMETPTRQIGAKEAADLDKALRTGVEDLRRDFTTLFARYSTYLQELANLNAVRDAQSKTHP